MPKRGKTLAPKIQRRLASHFPLVCVYSRKKRIVGKCFSAPFALYSGRCFSLLKKGRYTRRASKTGVRVLVAVFSSQWFTLPDRIFFAGAVYMAAVLEYLTAEVNFSPSPFQFASFPHSYTAIIDAAFGACRKCCARQQKEKSDSTLHHGLRLSPISLSPSPPSTKTCCHLQLAIRNDEELNKLLSHVTISCGGVLPNIQQVLLKKKGKSSSFSQEV